MCVQISSLNVDFVPTNLNPELCLKDNNKNASLLSTLYSLLMYTRRISGILNGEFNKHAISTLQLCNRVHEKQIWPTPVASKMLVDHTSLHRDLVDET